MPARFMVADMACSYTHAVFNASRVSRVNPQLMDF